jgi:DNA-binding IclR family transcriptional regulator
MSRDQTRGDGRENMLERGVHVMQAFRPGGGTLTLTTLTERTGLPKATVHRLSESLVDLGLLERRTVGYRLGLGLFELGELVSAKVNLREVALPFIQDLYEATHETVHLAIRDGLDVLYAEKIRGHRGVDVPSRVGGHLPLSSTGVGKALLAFAFADPEVVDAVLSRPLRRLTDKSLSDPAQLLEQLDEVRRTHLAFDREESAAGVSCLAAPVIVDGHAVAALSLTLPTEEALFAGLAPALRTASLALSRALARSSGSGEN